MATATLRKQGFMVKVGPSQYSDTVASADVISQSPTAGRTQHRGDTITLVVSKGPHLVTVPNVVLHSESRAIADLEAVGLHVRTSRVLGGILHVVRLQSAAAGTRVHIGSTVTLTIV